MNRRKFLACTVLVAALFFVSLLPARAEKPPLTLDEFFNWVNVPSVEVSPNGREVVIVTKRPDWAANRFREDLWLYRVEGETGGSLIPLTQSGHDSDAQWSPDGHWIAFLSDRAQPSAQAEDDDGAAHPKSVKQVYLISPAGGEAIRLTEGDEEVHAFVWSADSTKIFFATRNPWSKEQEKTYKKEWKDVIQYRESERSDTIFSVELRSVFAAPPRREEAEPASDAAPRELAATPYRVAQIVASPDGRHLAFDTISRSQRMDSLEPYGIYLVDLPGGQVRLLSHTRAIYQRLHWSPDGRHIFFSVEEGSVEGPYRDTQPRVYWIAADNGTVERWGAKFVGALNSYAAASDGSLVALGRLGTEVQIYSQPAPEAPFSKDAAGWPGTYEKLSAAAHSPRVAFVYSTLQKPTEVYLAVSPQELEKARPITAFNQLFTARALPQGKPFRWVADDGTKIEGMLIYPPGKFEARGLPMLTLIHGGPEDADGDHFEADWYQWSALAATDGWLAFQPNYRGSTGYGDAFTLGVVPRLVSRPGKDILEGVDALVKEGVADPNHLTIGGYSYGGYMTNWLITQTTRFRAAVTGAGAIEHALN